MSRLSRGSFLLITHHGNPSVPTAGLPCLITQCGTAGAFRLLHTAEVGM